MKQELDEFSLFKGPYERYKNRVLAYLKRLGIEVIETNHEMEEWIRSWFVDKCDELDCAKALRDNHICEGVINISQPLKEEVNNMNSEEELMIAKRTAERAGYKVEFPAPAAPQGGRGQIADNAAKIAAARARLGLGAAQAPAAQAPVPPQMTAADELERLALAARTAEKAGYTVRRAEVQPAPAPAPEAASAPEKKEYAPWLKGAVNFMNREQ